MPLVDSNLASTWSELYSCLIDGKTVGYTRAAKQQYYGRDHFTLIEALGVTNQMVALIGAGFGWSAEDWLERGVDVVATDISTWIQQNAAHEASIDIINESSMTEQSRAAIREEAGRDIDIAITEDVMPNLTDHECVELAENLRLLAPKVVHWISCWTPSSTASPLNMKTIEDWKALLAPDLVVSRGSGEVI